jgi:hypothetical protein
VFGPPSINTRLEPFRMYVASPCPTLSNRTMSSLPPESLTNVVTGGRTGFRGVRLCTVDDFRVRFDWPCLAWTKNASDMSAALSKKRRLSKRLIVLNYFVRLEGSVVQAFGCSSFWAIHHRCSPGRTDLSNDLP